jgi:hypothetical protein
VVFDKLFGVKRASIQFVGPDGKKHITKARLDGIELPENIEVGDKIIIERYSSSSTSGRDLKMA